MHKHIVIGLFAVCTAIMSVGTAVAEEKKKQNIEDMVEKPVGGAVTDLGLAETKRAKLTEDQAMSQLKYMMVAAFKRVEPQLLEKGSFKPMGMTLDPDGNFRAIRVDGQDEMPQNIAVDAIVQSLQGLAANRTQWAVGLIYVTGNKTDDGEIFKRIVVVGEHIAGWARTWHYPYRVIDGQVKMGRPQEAPMKPIYFQ